MRKSEQGSTITALQLAMAVMVMTACHDLQPPTAPSRRPPAALAARITGSTISDLGLADGATAYGVNNNGQVLIQGPNADQYSVLTGNGQQVNLVPPIGAIGPGFISPDVLDDAGQVAATFPMNDGWHLFLMTLDRGSTDLGQGPIPGGGGVATALNAHGDAAVYSSTRSFVWTRAAGFIEIVGGPMQHPTAMGMNDLGQVVGALTTENRERHAFIWTAAAGMRDLGTLDLVGTNAVAMRINNHGAMVGRRLTATGFRAFLWTEAGGTLDLGTLGGASSFAADVNDAGQVVGNAETAAGQGHAFLWTVETGMIDLGTLGGRSAVARSINEHGEIVGWATDATEHIRAVRWRLTLAPTTPQEALAQLATLIDGFMTNGTLSRGNAQGLLAKIDAATRQLSAGRSSVVRNILEALVNQVQAYARSGTLSVNDAQTLTDAARQAISLLP